MPSTSAELVRRIYEEGLFDRHPDRLLALAAPDVEYVNPPEAVDSGTRRGAADVAQAFQNLAGSFASFRHELRELFDVGDCVVAWVDFCAQSSASPQEIVQKEAHTWTFRDNQIVRFEWGRDLDAALAAAKTRAASG
jgi:ketosteroid isomerase-like protein